MTVFFIAKSELGNLKDVLASMKEVNEVKELHAITGEFDILAKLDVREDKAIETVMEKLIWIKGIKESRTLIGNQYK